MQSKILKAPFCSSVSQDVAQKRFIFMHMMMMMMMMMIRRTLNEVPALL